MATLATLGGAPSSWGAESCLKRVFVTREKYQGNMGVVGGGGLSRADRICQMAALAGNLKDPQNYLAFLSTAQVDAISRVSNKGGPFCLTKLFPTLPEVVVFPTKAAMLTASTPDFLDQQGFPLVSTDEPWTGTEVNGLAHPEHCDSWKSLEGFGGFGERSATTPGKWIRENSAGCSRKLHLYCVYGIPGLSGQQL